MKCLECNKEIKRKPNANNQKYCHPKCRRKADYKRNNKKEWQREYLQKKLRKKNTIMCLICGKHFRQLGSHVFLIHKITALEYRKRFGFDRYETRHTLVPELKELYGKQALENGTVANLVGGKKYRYKKGDKHAGTYERSIETMERLKSNSFLNKKK